MAGESNLWQHARTFLTRRRLVRVGLWVGLLVVFSVMFRAFEQSQVYHPMRTLEASGRELGRPMEDVYFHSKDGIRLNGWFFPADASSEYADLVVVFCHGNAGNISHRLECCGALMETGVAVFVFDYRGYGNSAGKPTEAGTYLDAAAACEWLKRRGFARRRQILYGESLGGGVASEIASQERPAGLVLQSCFTSIPDLGGELFPWLPVRWLATIWYDTRAKLSRVHCPVLVLHSRKDELVRFSHAQANYEAANNPKLLREVRGGHNDSLDDRPAFLSAIHELLIMVRAEVPGERATGTAASR